MRNSIALFFFLIAGAAFAQGTSVPFGGMEGDRDAPVEVTADQLAVSDADDTAIFTGNVVIGQNDMRLSAPRVEVIYTADQSGISRLLASGGVTLVSGEDAAEAQEADYDVEAGIVIMTGDVLLTQTANTLVSDRMRLDLEAGTAQMDGRVRTVLQPGRE
nr:lipopolysaccharide transport periplasmic protein LptA [Poseidonocella pacifica]